MIKKMNEESAKLKAEITSLKQREEATHKEENDRLNAAIKSSIDQWTEAAKKKTAGTSREASINQTTNNLNEIMEDMPMTKKRQLASMFDVIHVASMDQGYAQLGENEAKRRKFSLSEDSGNSSFYARLNDTIGIHSSSESHPARAPPQNLSTYLDSMDSYNGLMPTVTDDDSSNLYSATVGARFLERHIPRSAPSQGPRSIDPY